MELKPIPEQFQKFETYKTKLRNIYQRIPLKVIKQRPEIEKIMFPEPLVIYEGISKIENKEKMKIPKGLSESKEKKLISLLEFKEMMHKFNKQEQIYIKNEPIKKENQIFSNNYENLLKQKNKYNTGTYLDQDFLIPIANRYAQRGIKIPKISNDKNIFRSNPLILNGIELENYFLYNLGEKYKSTTYLKKVDEIVERKLAGNYVLSDQEERRLEYLRQHEKPKGYIPLNVLIPQLKNDIIKTQKTLDYLEKNDISFKNDNNNEIKNTEKTSNKQNNNNIYNYSTNITNSSKNIRIKRSLSLINYNKFSSRINSSASTKEQNSQRFSLLNPRIASPYLDYNPKSNIYSAISREKSRLIYPAKIEKKNILNYLKQKLLNNDKVRDIFSSYNRVNNTTETENINTINSLNSNTNEKKILKRNLKSINSINSSVISAISRESKENLLSVNKELPKTNTENTNLNNSSNNNINNNNKIILNILKGKGRRKKEKFKKKLLSYELKRREEEYRKCENLFNSILEGKFQMERSGNVLSDFLQSRGYRSIKKLNNKDNVLNINRMKNKSMERNFILEEYKLRSPDNGKSPLTAEQQTIINKNEDFNKRLEQNEMAFKKLICEKDIDKDSFNS